MKPLQLLTFSLVLINEALCTTVMFPFVGKFITVLDKSMDESSAGYYSGILLGAYQGAMTIFCSRWGQVSDVVGRKPVFLIGFCSGAFCMFMVGMSESLWMAILFRVLHGVCAANAPLAKTYAAEVTEKENLAKVFGLLSVTWSFGAFVGPMIGGFLYEPATSPFLSKFAIFSSPDSLFVTRPALLPCATIAAYTLVAAALTSAFLPESNMRAIGFRGWLLERFFSKRRYGLSTTVDNDDDTAPAVPVPLDTHVNHRDGGEEEARELVAMEPQPSVVVGEGKHNHRGRRILADSDDDAARSVSNSSIVSIDLEYTSAPPILLHHSEASPHPHRKRDSDDDDESHTSDHHSRNDDATSSSSSSRSEFSWGHLLRHPILRRCIPMYMALCAYNIVYSEILPLYGIALQKDEGLQISTTDIGFVFTANAAISVVMNLLFPHVTKRCTTLFLWRACNLMFAATVMLNGVTTSLNSYHSRSLTMGWLIFLAFFRCTASTWCFSLSMMFVANAAPPEHLGKVTGMSHSFGSLMRSLWPLVAAPMFAWSISSHHWFPFNHYLVFAVSALLALYAYYLSLSLTEDDVMNPNKIPQNATSAATTPRTTIGTGSVSDDEA